MLLEVGQRVVRLKLQARKEGKRHILRVTGVIDQEQLTEHGRRWRVLCDDGTLTVFDEAAVVNNGNFNGK